MGIKVIRRFPDISKPGFDFKKWNRQFHSHNVILNGLYSDYYYPSHWGPLSMKCAFGGSEYYITSGIKYSVDNKSYLILNDGTYYDSMLKSENKVESFTVNFRSEFAADVLYSLSGSLSRMLDYPYSGNLPAPGFFEKLYEHDNVTLSILKDIRNLINRESTDELKLSEKIHLLLEYMFIIKYSSLKQAAGMKASRYSTRIELYKRLNRAKDCITSNYNEKLDIDMISKIACLSPHHFLRSFSRAFGSTPHGYLTKIRMEKAKELISTTNIPVYEVCIRVGYESHSTFGALFRKNFGLPPEKFRTSLKKQF